MLEYYVYNEDVNNKEIIKYNIFKNSRFMEGLTEAHNQFVEDKDLDKFKENVKNQLLYSYWGRCEYEVVITSWPPHVNVEEIDRVKNEIDEHNSKFNWKQVRAGINLSVGEKISIYDQVMLNFDIFFNYILEHASELASKKMREKKK